jgi:sigma-B regulation protein RsbU (phosphoserine phosphatase)
VAIPAQHVHDQLVERRSRVQGALQSGIEEARLVRLLKEIDAALERTVTGTYGFCDVCHDPIEPERLAADPLVRTCIDHLSDSERRTLEHDLELASRVQRELLPPRRMQAGGWDIAYRYDPLGPVSGDYCDLILSDGGCCEISFFLGDVSGKGVAAAMLMSHIHACVRSMVAMSLPIQELLDRTNRLLCEHTIASHYATLVCGRLHEDGRVEIANAGHCPPLLVRGGHVDTIEGTGLPVGLFCSGVYTLTHLALQPGDTLMLYTDGVTEMFDDAENEYGVDRLSAQVSKCARLEPERLVRECLSDLASFRGSARRTDDVTLMAIRR